MLQILLFNTFKLINILMNTDFVFKITNFDPWKCWQSDRCRKPLWIHTSVAGVASAPFQREEMNECEALINEQTSATALTRLKFFDVKYVESSVLLCIASLIRKNIDFKYVPIYHKKIVEGWHILSF